MAETQNPSTDDLQPCNYAAAFIDILGQRAELARFPRLPNTKDEEAMAEFLAVVKSTVGTVVELRRNIRSFFDAFTEHSAAPYLPEPLRSAFEQYTAMEIRFQAFSDGLFIYVPLAVDKIPVPVRGILGLFAACGMASLIGLAAGRPVRGGIEVGWGVEYAPNELYGSAVSRSYDLESKVARYPRFVIGEQLAEYINAIKLNPAEGIPAEMGRAFAAYCQRMLTTDNDGYPIVDYLGSAFREVVGNGITRDTVEKAYDFVVHQLLQWKKQKNTKLAFRHSLLRDYFHARLPDWGITPADETAVEGHTQ